MSDVSYRLLTEDDVTVFREMRLRACRDEPSSFLEDYNDLCGKEEKHFLRHFKNGWIAGAFIDGTLVGITGLYRHLGAKLAHKGTIWGVYTAPEARGRSIGRNLLNMVITEAKQYGLELITISTSLQNPITMHLYQSVGFIPCGVEMHIIRLPDGTYVDDVQMIQFLK